MISPDLIRILCCPESKQPLHLGSASELSGLNDKIQKNILKTRDGNPITVVMDSFLIREDRQFGYRIQNNIPILLIGEGFQI